MVVSLAAINAMDCGRKRANELRRQWHIQQAAAATSALVNAHELPQGQSRITQFFVPAALTPAQQQHQQMVQQRRQDHQQQLQLQQAQQRQTAIDRLLLQAKQQAVARFWQLLADFVILNPCPVQGFDDLLHNHPFICLNGANFVILSPRHHVPS